MAVAGSKICAVGAAVEGEVEVGWDVLEGFQDVVVVGWRGWGAVIS